VTPAIDPVIATVTAQKNAYGELLRLARAKRETIVRGDIVQLDDILAAEATLLHQLATSSRVEPRPAKSWLIRSGWTLQQFPGKTCPGSRRSSGRSWNSCRLILPGSWANCSRSTKSIRGC
jgi:hypothetical protein